MPNNPTAVARKKEIILEALKFDPNNPNMLLTLGALERVANNPEKAADFFREAIKNNSSWFAYGGLAEYYYQFKNEPSKAIDVLYEAIQNKNINQKEAEPLYLSLIALLQQQGRSQEAIEVSKKVAALRK